MHRERPRLPTCGCPACPPVLACKQVVPTDYIDRNGISTITNQFSVTENFRESTEASSGGRSLPGVFYFYDLSPIKVCAVSGTALVLCRHTHLAVSG